MMYIDGYLIPIPMRNLPAYRWLAQKAGRICESTAPSTTGNVSAMTSHLTSEGRRWPRCPPA